VSGQAQDKAEDTVVTTVVLSRPHHSSLKAIAARQHRTMSGVIRHWIERDALEQQRIAAEAAA
jgi:predicted XRE-type DNA-binding protein